MVLIGCLMTWRMIHPIYRYGSEANSLWLGFGAGAVGALFFTGLRFRTRDLNTDLQPWENRADATARILIGAIAGAVIVALLKSDLLSISLGEADIPGPNNELAWLKLAIAGFVGGYSERLVTTVLDRASTAGSRSGTQTLVGSAGTIATGVGGGTASETNPLGRVQTSAPQPAPESEDVAPVEGDDVDACGSDEALDPAEATDDVELPATTGGVAEASESPPPAPPPPGN